MAKLYFRYSAMNAGKSTALLQVAHNYEEKGMHVLLMKPAMDTKGDESVVSRLGVSRKVDVLFHPDDNLIKLIAKQPMVDCILVDEAQFCTPEHIDQLFHLAVIDDIPVICYGLRTDFQLQGFPGSTRLLLLAHELEELKTICQCGKKAICNMRFVHGKPAFLGQQVTIDGKEGDTYYESVCGRCYINKKSKMKNQKLKPKT